MWSKFSFEATNLFFTKSQKVVSVPFIQVKWKGQLLFSCMSNVYQGNKNLNYSPLGTNKPSAEKSQKRWILLLKIMFPQTHYCIMLFFHSYNKIWTRQYTSYHWYSNFSTNCRCLNEEDKAPVLIKANGLITWVPQNALQTLNMNFRLVYF